MLIAILILAMTGATGQKDSEPTTRPKRGDTVVARGCVTGGVTESATLDSPEGASRYLLPLTYRLTGDKKLLKSLKQEHANHADVITGVLKTDLPDERRERGAKIGNTRIGLGVPNPNASTQQVLPVLEVKSFEHVDLKCR